MPAEITFGLCIVLVYDLWVLQRNRHVVLLPSFSSLHAIGAPVESLVLQFEVIREVGLTAGLIKRQPLI